jgi:hypothetical protein
LSAHEEISESFLISFFFWWKMDIVVLRYEGIPWLAGWLEFLFSSVFFFVAFE